MITVGIEFLNNFKTAKEEDDWFWDEITNNGFSFDRPDWYACKWPLGRQGGYKATKKIKLENGVEQEIIVNKANYELICTPKQMAAFQSNAPKIRIIMLVKKKVLLLNLDLLLIVIGTERKYFNI